MLDQWVTESLCCHTIARVLFFQNRFQRNIWAEKSKDECSKTIKPISKFLSHIKSTWFKLRIHNTFTKFSKSWHIPFNLFLDLVYFQVILFYFILFYLIWFIFFSFVSVFEFFVHFYLYLLSGFYFILFFYHYYFILNIYELVFLSFISRYLFFFFNVLHLFPSSRLNFVNHFFTFFNNFLLHSFLNNILILSIVDKYYLVFYRPTSFSFTLNVYILSIVYLYLQLWCPFEEGDLNIICFVLNTDLFYGFCFTFVFISFIALH